MNGYRILNQHILIVIGNYLVLKKTQKESETDGLSCGLIIEKIHQLYLKLECIVTLKRLTDLWKETSILSSIVY